LCPPPVGPAKFLRSEPSCLGHPEFGRPTLAVDLRPTPARSPAESFALPATPVLGEQAWCAIAPAAGRETFLPQTSRACFAGGLAPASVSQLQLIVRPRLGNPSGPSGSSPQGRIGSRTACEAGGGRWVLPAIAQVGQHACLCFLCFGGGPQRRLAIRWAAALLKLPQPPPFSKCLFQRLNAFSLCSTFSRPQDPFFPSFPVVEQAVPPASFQNQCYRLSARSRAAVLRASARRIKQLQKTGVQQKKKKTLPPSRTGSAPLPKAGCPMLAAMVMGEGLGHLRAAWR